MSPDSDREIVVSMSDGSVRSFEPGFANARALILNPSDGSPRPHSTNFGFIITAAGDLVVNDDLVGGCAYAAGTWLLVEHHLADSAQAGQVASRMLPELPTLLPAPRGLNE